jgi:hypothetical protein
LEEDSVFRRYSIPDVDMMKKAGEKLCPLTAKGKDKCATAVSV